ncbi:hypothetical protein AC579_2313 [Pseudocercospora musae]|uniref:Uncharacterized protein n=1 Tax=Pseudocercospora musae TaxID=113226 RepID=A0A139I8B1_9PEZI|nr:hypothetical protein AC579_2313 [Pseudocercospora musae]KXT10782.1 hypothetical protein AC579_2313 [Pseudocercospora musae]
MTKAAAPTPQDFLVNCYKMMLLTTIERRYALHVIDLLLHPAHHSMDCFTTSPTSRHELHNSESYELRLKHPQNLLPELPSTPEKIWRENLKCLSRTKPME